MHRARPAAEREQPSAALVRATGKCAECHRQETSAIVHQYERSAHAVRRVSCLDCHQPARPADRRVLTATLWVLAAQVPVGLLGFGLHMRANLGGPAQSVRDDFLYGAPIFAPLLLPNLALLGAIAVLHLRRRADAAPA